MDKSDKICMRSIPWKQQNISEIEEELNKFRDIYIFMTWPQNCQFFPD